MGPISTTQSSLTINSLSGLHAASWGALASLRMPSTRNEEYRYTDIAPLLKEGIRVSARSPTAASSQKLFVEQSARKNVSGLILRSLISGLIYFFFLSYLFIDGIPS